MTTIAYKDWVMAFDSRVSADGTIYYDDFDKSRTVGDVKFFFAGRLCDVDGIVKCWFGGDSAVELDAYALVFDGARLWYVSHTLKDGLRKAPLLLGSPYSIGSGSAHALTAMDMGATADEAVSMAARRDTATGGVIRVIHLARNDA